MMVAVTVTLLSSGVQLGPANPLNRMCFSSSGVRRRLFIVSGPA